MGSGPVQLGRKCEREGGRGGKSLIFWVGTRGADSWVVQYEGHVCRAMGSLRDLKSISGHDVLVSENPVYRYSVISSNSKDQEMNDTPHVPTKVIHTHCQGS